MPTDMRLSICNPAVHGGSMKYPQWYDMFQERGYDVTRETAVFNRIWVGTETRDYTNAQWGHTPQYEGYFLMRRRLVRLAWHNGAHLRGTSPADSAGRRARIHAIPFRRASS
jgi:hypothetical protein